MPLTTVNPGLLDSQAQYTGFKNRIINGSMMIDQRNAGASVTASGGVYSLDRWATVASQPSKYTVQQNAGSVTPPVGFTNYIGITSSSAYSVGATENFELQQRIEGLNMADLAWGTASASAVTLSFYVYSSLTGTFGGFLCNSATNYSYPFSYTISAANTWQRITLTIAGPTSGTWLTTNGIGVFVGFSLGAGSSTVGTGGSWYNGTLYRGVTGQVNLVATNGATLYITGVQLEKGSTATSFDYRPYGTELALCQRYYEKVFLDYAGYWNGVNSFRVVVPMKVEKRATPTGVIADANWAANSLNFSGAGFSANYPSQVSLTIDGTGSGVTTRYSNSVAMSAEL